MTSFSQLGLVLITTGSESEADQISETLIEVNLAACVAITPIKSVYRWQGVIHKDEEYQLVIKTDLALFEKIVSYVKQHHSYELPEIIAIPMATSTADYGQWIQEQLQKLD
ncbi:MAG: divalent-cation tolerance protein CutA [Cyanobacteria bacterium P01_D01_bin.156]